MRHYDPKLQTPIRQVELYDRRQNEFITLGNVGYDSWSSLVRKISKNSVFLDSPNSLCWYFPENKVNCLKLEDITSNGSDLLKDSYSLIWQKPNKNYVIFSRSNMMKDYFYLHEYDFYKNTLKLIFDSRDLNQPIDKLKLISLSQLTTVVIETSGDKYLFCLNLEKGNMFLQELDHSFSMMSTSIFLDKNHFLTTGGGWPSDPYSEAYIYKIDGCD